MWGCLPNEHVNSLSPVVLLRPFITDYDYSLKDPFRQLGLHIHHLLGGKNVYFNHLIVFAGVLCIILPPSLACGLGRQRTFTALHLHDKCHAASFCIFSIDCIWSFLSQPTVSVVRCGYYAYSLTDHIAIQLYCHFPNTVNLSTFSLYLYIYIYFFFHA